MLIALGYFNSIEIWNDEKYNISHIFIDLAFYTL